MEEETTDHPEPSLAGRVTSFLMFLLVPPVVLAALLVGLGYVRLMHGPFTVKPLTAVIERALAAELPGLGVRIAEVDVALADGSSVEFRLKNIRITEGDGDLVASAPMAVASLSWPALKRLRIAPERVELIEPRLSLSISEDGRLALAFKHVTTEEAVETSQPSPEPARGPAPAANATEEASGHRLDVARVLAEASARARRREDAASYLKEIGIRTAHVLFEHGGQRSEWLVPSFSVDLDHRKKRSVVAGAATISSPKGPWTLTFRTEDSEATRSLKLDVSVRDLVPSGLGDGAPGVALLQGLDMPVASDAQIELSRQGDVLNGAFKLELGRGQVRLPGLTGAPLTVDAGLLSFTYDPVQRQLTLQPSTLVSGQSRVTLIGGARRAGTKDGAPSWSFEIEAKDGVLAAEDLGAGAVAVEKWAASGLVVPRLGLMEIEAAVLRAGGAEVSLAGEVSAAGGQAGARVEGRLSPMSVATLKAIWPKALAPPARKWVGAQVTRADIRGGSFRLASGPYLAGQPPPSPASPSRLTLTIETGEVSLVPAPGMLPLEAPRVLTRVEDSVLEITAPDAAIVLGGNRRLPLKSFRLSGTDLDKPGTLADVSMRIQTPLAQAVEAIDQPALELLKQSGVVLDGAEGKVEGQIKLAMPVGDEFDRSLIRAEGKVKVSDGRMKQVGGSLDVQGAGVTFEFSDKAIDAKGEMLVNGVPAKLTWQRIFDAPPDKQPPVRLTMVLDNADRNQLGLDVNHMMQGEVPVEVTVSRGPQGDSLVRMRADLTNAELNVDTIAWRKPAGRSAYVQFDIVKGRTAKYELQNLQLAGDDIAIEGSASLGADNRPMEFHFPSFSFNVVTRLDVRGKLRSDNVWDIKAKGSTFDGRDFFRALFNVGAASVKPQKPRAGTDVDAEIDTVIGFSEVSLRGVKLKLSKRGDKLSGLAVTGTLDGGQPLAVELRQKPGEPRRLLADSSDAGQAFKLTGFYPNVVGGRVRLEVNVDGRGPAEKTGVLWVESFKILGDPVVSEVVGTADTSRPAISDKRGGRKVVREEFDFDRMKLPFAVGHGQFVVEDSYLRGPLLGATLRGKVDFNTRNVNLGGTYVPLQGLNNALGGIPLLGELLSGPRGEGIFGITFAIQGAMAQPQVIVNPLSPLTPGILRGLMELTDPDLRVRAPEEKKPAVPAEKRVRASSTPATRGDASGAASTGAPIDGWTSESKAEAPSKKR